MEKPKILVILGSTREGRRGDKIADAAMESLSKEADANFELIDLKDWDIPFYNLPGYPSTEKGVFGSEIQKKWAEKIDSADGFIFVTPEYNHGYTAVLKNAIDFLWYEWNHKPVSFISYGSMSGGLRAVEQLRQVVIEVEMVPIRESVALMYVRKLFDENGKFNDPTFDHRVIELGEKIAAWAKGLKKIRKDLAY